jgi:hypothetical protein
MVIEANIVRAIGPHKRTRPAVPAPALAELFNNKFSPPQHFFCSSEAIDLIDDHVVGFQRAKAVSKPLRNHRQVKSIVDLIYAGEQAFGRARRIPIIIATTIAIVVGAFLIFMDPQRAEKVSTLKSGEIGFGRTFRA